MSTSLLIRGCFLRHKCPHNSHIRWIPHQAINCSVDSSYLVCLVSLHVFHVFNRKSLNLHNLFIRPTLSPHEISPQNRQEDRLPSDSEWHLCFGKNIFEVYWIQVWGLNHTGGHSSSRKRVLKGSLHVPKLVDKYEHEYAVKNLPSSPCCSEEWNMIVLCCLLLQNFTCNVFSTSILIAGQIGCVLISPVWWMLSSFWKYLHSYSVGHNSCGKKN